MTRLRPWIFPLALFPLLAAVLAVVLLSGGPQSTAPASRLCPQGSAAMGCEVAKRAAQSFTLSIPPEGPKFVDVSSYQGHPNWDIIKGHVSMAAVKAGEYVEDPDFAWNIQQLNRLHIPWAPYWFVRNTGCVHEGQEIVSVIKSVGGLTSLPVVLDLEVPEAHGYAPCLDAAVYGAFHRHAVIYTAPGTWPGGSDAGLKLWGAAYGPVKPCVWTCSLIAWQYTDGSIGASTYIPGLGFGDVSVDYGFSKLLPHRVDLHYGRFAVGPFSSPWGNLSERQVVQAYDAARARGTKSLTHLKAELAFLAARDSAIARRQLVHGKPSWGVFNRGWRFQQLIHRDQGHRFV